jgi:hypothetical protein
MSEEKNTQLEFPCKFPIKIMGKCHEEFEKEVVAIINKHVPDLEEDALTVRPSKEGTYIAITATITAQSREQLDNIYFELSAHERVIMAL